MKKITLEALKNAAGESGYPKSIRELIRISKTHGTEIYEKQNSDRIAQVILSVRDIVNNTVNDRWQQKTAEEWAEGTLRGLMNRYSNSEKPWIEKYKIRGETFIAIKEEKFIKSLNSEEETTNDLTELILNAYKEQEEQEEEEE